MAKENITKHILVGLTKSEAEAFCKIAANQNLRPGVLVSDIVRKYIQDHADEPPLPGGREFSYEKTNILIRASTEELKLIDSMAREFALSRARTLTKALAAFVYPDNFPLTTLEERQALRESSEAIRAIGFNLNQIAKCLNTLKKNPDDKILYEKLCKSLQEELKTLEHMIDRGQLSKNIDEHVRKIYNLVNACKNRFSFRYLAPMPRHRSEGRDISDSK